MTVMALDRHAQKLQGVLSDYLWVSVLIRRMDYSPEEIRGHNRATRFVEVRQAIARTLRNEGWSLLRIAKAMHRDHSSIIWLLRGGRHKKCA